MKSSSKALLWVLLVFVVGVGVGATATFLVVRARLINAGVIDPSQRRGQLREGSAFRQMLSQLDLDAEQETAVRAILQETRRGYVRIEKEKNQKLRLERRQAIQEIRRLLNPEQQAKLDEFLRGRSLRRRQRQQN